MQKIHLKKNQIDALYGFEKELKCDICNNIFNNPYTTDCEHHFCKNCIFDELRYKSECPTCNLPLPPSNVHCNPVLNNIVETYTILADLTKDVLQPTSTNKKKKKAKKKRKNVTESSSSSITTTPQPQTTPNIEIYHEMINKYQSELEILTINVSNLMNLSRQVFPIQQQPSQQSLTATPKRNKSNDYHSTNKIVEQSLDLLAAYDDTTTSPIQQAPSSLIAIEIEEDDDINATTTNNNTKDQTQGTTNGTIEQDNNDDDDDDDDDEAVEPTQFQSNSPEQLPQQPTTEDTTSSISATTVEGDDDDDDDDSDSSSASSSTTSSTSSNPSSHIRQSEDARIAAEQLSKLPRIGEKIIITTSLTPSQSQWLRRVVQKLGNARVIHRFHDRIGLPHGIEPTHVISGRAKIADGNWFVESTTLKLMYGIALGVWVVRLDWIQECERLNRWIDEDEYELGAVNTTKLQCVGDDKIISHGAKNSRFRRARQFPKPLDDIRVVIAPASSSSSLSVENNKQSLTHDQSYLILNELGADVYDIKTNQQSNERHHLLKWMKQCPKDCTTILLLPHPDGSGENFSSHNASECPTCCGAKWVSKVLGIPGTAPGWLFTVGTSYTYVDIKEFEILRLTK